MSGLQRKKKNTNTKMKTLKLFNAVLSKKPRAKNPVPFVSEDGFVIEPNALWAKANILDFYKNQKLSGIELNKTFHKSWKKIKNSSRYELLVEQIMHYMSTYGTNFQDEVYIPNEVLELPDVKLSYRVIRAYTKEEMTEKCLSLLRSGIALKSETIDDILSVLVDELDYTFSGDEGIRNREAVVKIADAYGILPKDTMEFFRYVIYKATGDSLVIKNDQAIEAIKSSSFNPSALFKQFGIEKLAQIFNRFKPLFLAFKTKCPKTINKISKYSKAMHKPMVSNPLNHVTSSLLSSSDMHWLDNATPYAIFKLLSALHTRIEGQTSFVYRVRNGKSWAKENAVDEFIVRQNFDMILGYIKERFDFSGKKFYFPEGVQFALPTSEKMYVGNIPTGTKFSGKKMAVGVYWKDSWGARDIDLSGLQIDGGKVGWNASYGEGSGHLMYSGDITSAPNGAVEYLYANKGLNSPTLVQTNVFSGNDDCEYKIIIGKGDKISNNYMMDPSKLFAEVKCQSIQKQTILGMFIPEEETGTQSFIVLNFGAGHARVSGYSESSRIAMQALYEQWRNPISFNEFVLNLGGEMVSSPEDADFDLSLDSLERDSFTKVFESTKKLQTA